MIKNIIFLSWVDFTRRDYLRYGIKELQGFGFRVEIWEIKGVFSRNIQAGKKSTEQGSFVECRSIDDKNELTSKLRSLSKEDFIISSLPLDLRTRFLYQILRERGIRYGLFQTNMLPRVRQSQSGAQRLLLRLNLFKRFKNFGVSQIANLIFIKWIARCMTFPKARLVLLGGRQSFVRTNPLIDENTRKVLAHTLDYDIYLQHKGDAAEVEPTAVFLDENFVFHPEYAMENENVPIDPERYYRLLNAFFDKLEKETRLKVVIALHPSSDLEQSSRNFARRPVFQGNTFSLVQKSQWVLCHASTSTNFANMMRKPILFLSFSDLQGSYLGAFIDEMASVYGKRALLVDRVDKIDWSAEAALNAEMYQKYFHDYIKSPGSEEKFSWEILAGELLAMDR